MNVTQEQIEKRMKQHYWGIRCIEDAYPKLKTSLLALQGLAWVQDPDIDPEDVGEIILVLSEFEKEVSRALKGKAKERRHDAPRTGQNATE